MSWPDDGRPRFVVGSMTGYGGSFIMGRGNSSRREITDYYVYDRAYNHAIVRAYPAGQHTAQQRARERRAHEACAVLNAQHAPLLDDALLGLAKRR